MIPQPLLSLSSLSHTSLLRSHCRCPLYNIRHYYDPTATPLTVLFITYVIITIPLSLSSLSHTPSLRSHCHCPLYYIRHSLLQSLCHSSLSSLSDNIRPYHDPIVTVLFITYVITTIPLSLIRSHCHCPLYHILHHFDPIVTVLFITITYVITRIPQPLLSLSSLSHTHHYDPTVLFITNSLHKGGSYSLCDL